MLLSSFLWFLGTLLLLVLVQRWVHKHLHGVAYLLTGHADMALMLYALPLLPGVALHELSHALMATVLGVKTANLTIIPQRQPDGHVRLGSVRVERVDVVRSSLIGLAENCRTKIRLNRPKVATFNNQLTWLLLCFASDAGLEITAEVQAALDPIDQKPVFLELREVHNQTELLDHLVRGINMLAGQVAPII